MICEFCGADDQKPIFYANGEEMSSKFAKPVHDCHCVYSEDEKIEKNGKSLSLRIAWGICCARHTVGISLMSEEDFHDGCPWSVQSDCTCAE
jgi:hypothetical protein